MIKILINIVLMFVSFCLFSQENENFFNKIELSRSPISNCKYMVGLYCNDVFYGGEKRIKTPRYYPPPEVKQIIFYDETPPYIKYQNYKIVLSSEIEKLLKEYDPAFRPYNLDDYSTELTNLYPFSPYSTPSIIIGDFNGDGKKDILMEGKSERCRKKIAVMSFQNDYKIIEIYKFKRDNEEKNEILNSGMLLQPKGSIYYSSSDSSEGYNTHVLPNDGYARVKPQKGHLVIDVIEYYDTKTRKWNSVSACSYRGCHYSGMYYAPEEDYYE